MIHRVGNRRATCGFFSRLSPDSESGVSFDSEAGVTFSRHNLISRVRDTDGFFIMNFLSRQADLLPADMAERFLAGNYLPGEEADLAEKGYLVEEAEEDGRFRKAYLDFVEEREKSEKQLFYVSSYACNFACGYCYQEGYPDHDFEYRPEVIDAFLAYIDTEFRSDRKYVTIFGGEPLLPGDGPRKTLEHLIDALKARNLGYAIVTNGYNLASYVELLGRGNCREVQVTLDGVGGAHDIRRPLRGGQPTFDRVVTGVDAAIAAGLSVNLRMVLDKDNIGELPTLAAFARGRGWTSSANFKTQIGRNYELHYCQSDQSRLFDRVGLYEAIYSLAIRNPEILDFHKPAFSIARFLFDNGEMPTPLFDSCPATKSEWAFDYTGRIYSCTATVGKPGEELGTFYPSITRKDDLIEEWADRDVCSIEECSSCSVRLACGGGCGSVAKNNLGKILAPDCRPIKNLIEMGLALYGEKD